MYDWPLFATTPVAGSPAALASGIVVGILVAAAMVAVLVVLYLWYR